MHSLSGWSARGNRRPRRAPPAPLPYLIVLAVIGLGALGCGRDQPLSPQIHSSVETTRAASMARGGALDFVDPAPGQPLHITGKLGPGALFVIDKPANWNGVLVVWVHGYTGPADPIATPNLGPLLQFFLSQGYAVAASSYSENGYAVAEGARQTYQLGQVFTARVSKPDRTFLVGVSLGGIIGISLIEKFDREYAGALLVSGVVGGTDDEVRYLGDIWMLFDKFFPEANLPPLFGERPGSYPAAQLQALITDQAKQSTFQVFLAFARERGLQFASGSEAVQATLTALGFAWIGAHDLLDRTHGHVLYDNQETIYTAPGVPQSIVDDVNATIDRLAATPDVGSFVRSYYEPDGDLEIPVITLHDQRDPLVPSWHEELFREAVEEAGKLSLLRQYTVDSFGHVSPSVQGQIPAKFLELVAWADALAATP